MSDANERSVASAGSVASEPVAYLVDGPLEKRVFLTRREAAAYRSGLPEIETASMFLVPLYDHPPLSAAERQTILYAIDAIRDRFEGYDDCDSLQSTLRDLLKRTK